jgi:hypothetical protein
VGRNRLERPVNLMSYVTLVSSSCSATRRRRRPA